MRDYGHSHAFQDVPDMMAQRPKDNSTGTQVKTDHAGETLKLRQRENHADLVNFAINHDNLPRSPNNGNLDWLTSLYHRSRGFELGTFDGSLAAVTMKKQSVNWEWIARGYIQDVIQAAHVFVRKLITHVGPTKKIREGLAAVLMERLRFEYRKAIAKVEHLLMIERMCIPTTLNEQFNEIKDRK